jgi:hypothetical protein
MVSVSATRSPNGRRVIVVCTTRSHIAFESMIGRSGGVRQQAISSAEGILQ